LGVGTKFWRIGGQKGYIVGRRQVLHVPALKAPLLSVRQHRRHQGCSFIADNEGCYLTFPTFSIKVDDSVDCLIAYETLNPTTVDLSECDYLQEASQRRESLAVIKTQRFENARSSQQQNSTSANAWKVETRASLCRLNEQAARELEAKDKAEQIKIELAHLEEESKATERQYQMPRPKAPMTTEEKLQLIQSLVDLMQKRGKTDYLLIKEVETKYPHPSPVKSDIDPKDEIDIDPKDEISPPSSPPAYKFPTTTSTPADHPDTLPCDKPPSTSPAVQCFTEQQLHRYFGFRNLKNWLDLEATGQDTIKVTKGTECPLEISDVANIRHSHQNTTPVPRPMNYLQTVHMDIGYGDCVSIGSFHYVLILIDRTT
jgi:hypothetical protein